MKISEVIAKLQAHMEKYGDIPCITAGDSQGIGPQPVDYIEPYWHLVYDMGGRWMLRKIIIADGPVYEEKPGHEDYARDT